MLTKGNVDEHIRQNRLCADLESSSELRRQMFERFGEAARVLGINFSDQVLAAMWQGLGGLTPMERFINEKDNLSVLREAAQTARHRQETKHGGRAPAL